MLRVNVRDLLWKTITKLIFFAVMIAFAASVEEVIFKRPTAHAISPPGKEQ